MKKILFVASEGVPFIKTGGLADVVGSLPKCIDRQYFDVRVVLPKYTCMRQEMKDKLSYVTHFYMDFHWKNEYVGILYAEVDGVKYYFIDNESFFNGFKPYSDRTPDYAGAPDIIWTEGTLGYASLALVLGEEAEAKKYVDECIALQNCSGSTGGVIYVTETYASLPWEFHVWESVVSSSWLYLLIKNPDVLFPRTLRQVYYMAKITNIKDQRP